MRRPLVAVARRKVARVEQAMIVRTRALERRFRRRGTSCGIRGPCPLYKTTNIKSILLFTAKTEVGGKHTW